MHVLPRKKSMKFKTLILLQNQLKINICFPLKKTNRQ
jgi:hypothetical protein